MKLPFDKKDLDLAFYIFLCAVLPFVALAVDGWKSALIILVVCNVLYTAWNFGFVLEKVLDLFGIRTIHPTDKIVPIMDESERYVSIHVNGSAYYGHYWGKDWLVILDLLDMRYGRGVVFWETGQAIPLGHVQFYNMEFADERGVFLVDTSDDRILRDSTPYTSYGGEMVLQSQLIETGDRYLLLSPSTGRYFNRNTKEYEPIKSFPL